MHFTQKQIVIIGAGIVLLAAVFLFISTGIKKAPVVLQPYVVTVWGTESRALFDDLSLAYAGVRPNAIVNYLQFDPATYENKLVTALAAGNGPDVFEIGNRSLARWKSLLAPLPTSTFFSGQIDPPKMQAIFPSVVADDFVSNGSIYGLPFSIDTLAMIYNRDYFDSAAIALPPKTWDDFDNDVLKLRIVSATGTISRAAVAMGGTRQNIVNGDDLLYLLMLQDGVQMVSGNRSAATFGSGVGALNFYLQFANPASLYYTWNDSMGDARQSFLQGKSAIYFGYYSDLLSIRHDAPFLNIGVAPMPQPSGATISVNYPRYTGLVAAKRGDVTHAWDFILTLTGYSAGETAYLKDANVPAAQRTALATQQSDSNLSLFATQALSARSWYEPDDQSTDAIFDGVIRSVTNGSLQPDRALYNAQSAVDDLIYRTQ